MHGAIAEAGIQPANFNCMDYSTSDQINALLVCLLIQSPRTERLPLDSRLRGNDAGFIHARSVLYSGDAISLAGVEIKFVQDAPRMITKSMDRTGPLPNVKIEEVPTQFRPPEDE